MRFISVRDAKARLSACLEDSQTEGIVVTNHGKPMSVVIGVEGFDIEEVVLMLSPSFWKTIEARRRQPRTSLVEFERELSLPRQGRLKRRRRT